MIFTAIQSLFYFKISLILAGFLFSPILGSFFLCDDFLHLREIEQGGAFGVWSGDDTSYYFRPVVSLSLFSDLLVWGRNPAGYHVTNLVIHFLNSLLIFLLAATLLRPAKGSSRKPDYLIPLFCSVLFLFLPCHSEAICWISGRTDLIAAFFALSSLLTFLRFKQTNRPSFFIISILLFLAGLFSKEYMLVFPCIIMACEFFVYKGRKNLFKLSMLYAAPVVVYLWVQHLTESVGGEAIPHVIGNLELEQMVRNFIPTFGRMFYSPLAPKLIFSFYILTGIVLAVILVRHKNSGEKSMDRKSVGVLLFLILSSSFFLLAMLTQKISMVDLEGERLLYVPSAFVVLSLLCFHQFINAYKRMMMGVLVAFSIIFVSLLYGEIRVWSDAGLISKTILSDLNRSKTAGRLYILNLPDNLYGAYVFRIGFKDAVRLFERRNLAQRIHIASYHPILRRSDRVHFQKLAADEYFIQLKNEKFGFMNRGFALPPRSKNKIFEIKLDEEGRCFIKLPRFQEGDRVLYYSEGRLRPAI